MTFIHAGKSVIPIDEYARFLYWIEFHVLCNSVNYKLEFFKDCLCTYIQSSIRNTVWHDPVRGRQF